MFTIALIGPDGAGKTTIARHLEKTFPLPVKYLYLGDNIASSNYVLPTTRWLKSRQQKQMKKVSVTTSGQTNGKATSNKPRHAGALRAGLKLVKKTFGFVNRILDEWYRLLVARYFRRRGYVVLFDRHFLYDYFHFDVQSQNGRPPLKRRLHGFFLKHSFPEPDLVICLDAPGEVIFKRKGEFTVEHLEKRRAQYLDLKNIIANFAVVDVNRDLDTVLRDVNSLIWAFYEKRQRHG